MKKSKWLKWKIGLFSTVGLAVLFHQVKVDPTFDIAVANASNTQQDTTQIAPQQDPITNQLDNSLNNNRQNSQYDSSNQSFGGSSSNTMPSGRSNTRTSRS
jgi:hypothetical protein